MKPRDVSLTVTFLSSFGAQCVNRVKARGALRRVEAEEHADGTGSAEGEQNGRERKCSRPLEHARQCGRGGIAKGQSDSGRRAAEGDGPEPQPAPDGGERPPRGRDES